MTVAAFVTDRGVVVPAITADQMREVDRVAVEEVGPNLFQMMENAGRNLAMTVMEHLGPLWRERRFVVLAGTGGNGGGGICAARHLANRGGAVTTAVDSGRIDGVPADQLRVYRGTSGRVAGVEDLPSLEADLVVDAAIGYGLGGAPLGAPLAMLEWAGDTGAPVISLDVPSGIDATTGETPGAHVHAALTLTLALPKTGLDAPAVGNLWLADIGVPREVYRRAGVAVSSDVFGDRFRVPLRVR